MDPTTLSDDALDALLDSLWTTWRTTSTQTVKRVELEKSITVAEKEQARRWQVHCVSEAS